MAVELSRWYDELAVHAPGATTAGMEQAVIGAVTEFLRESAALALEQPGISLKANKGVYYIPKPEEGPIICIIAALYKNKPLTPVTALSWLSMPRIPFTSSAPFRIMGDVLDANKITISPTPTVDLEDKLVPYVAVGYSPQCSSAVPDVFCRQWYDVILSGALRRLFMQPNKPYTNAELAAFHYRSFRNGIAVARDRARKQFMQQETPFRFPFWA